MSDTCLALLPASIAQKKIMIRRLITLLVAFFTCCPAIAQDPSLNNLEHAIGYNTSHLGQLDDVVKSGSGKQDMILLPGWGFDNTLFQDFMKRHDQAYRMFAITLPGFGKTQAPPMPAQPESYGNLYWTKGIINGLLDLIEREKIVKPIIITSFVFSNQVAMRFAIDYPDKVGKVIIVSGMAKFTANYPSYEPRTLEQRIAYIDKGLSDRWFRTVTKETWDKGNYPPETFCRDTVKAHQYWKIMSAVPIPVMVRYLCESYCMDLSLEYQNLTVPVLVVVPSFSQDFLGKNPFMAPFFHASWLGALPASKQIQIVTMIDANAFIQDDQPEKLDRLIDEFITGKFNPYPPVR